mmetsp:Transcript_7867/g.16418  ORF Transcript_7867/g.16418 Transcript_7867/m.16418 type:complete len:251 (-) Transcript_7867:564-1316(-)
MGTDGPASSTLVFPSAAISARTRPDASPAMNASPTRIVPRCMSVVATIPNPFSTRDSSTTPWASRSGLDLRSSTSACSRSLVRRASIPDPALALTSAHRMSPPSSSTSTSYEARSVLHWLGSAVSRSHLFTATTMGTPACRAHAMLSAVCSLTPSSAATTSTTMSVTSAPRWRMSEKAACPGVSMKEMRVPSCSTWYAAICWVIPPASPAVTRVSRMESRRLVLPWSTWPMMVTTGARGTRESGSSSSRA